jgi:ryanodine receptor 2
MTFWYNKDEPVFVDIEEESQIQVIRIPSGSDSPPALKIAHKLFETQEKACWEFLRLSLPVTCHEDFIDELEKNTRWEEVKRRIRRNKTERGFGYSAQLEKHMLQSGRRSSYSVFSIKSFNFCVFLFRRVFHI